MEKKLLAVFTRRKTNQKEFRIEKVIKRKGIKLYVKWKGYNDSFNTWIDKKGSYKMSQYFSPYGSSEKKIKEELDLSSYATKTDLKNVTHVDVSSFALKTDLANLKTEVDKMGIAKLTLVPDDSANLSNEVKNNVVKKTEYKKLVTKVDTIDTTGFVLKTTYDTDKSGLEKKISDVDKKIPNTSDLANKTDLYAEITETEVKIPTITGLGFTGLVKITTLAVIQHWKIVCLE